MRRLVFVSLALGVCAAAAHADELDPKLLSALKNVPLVDVIECKTGDEKSLQGLNSVIQYSGGKKDKKTKKAVAAFEERILYWGAVLDNASETDIQAGDVALKERQAERKKKLAEMSLMEQSVYMAKRDYPCDDIFEEARKSKKKAKKK